MTHTMRALTADEINAVAGAQTTNTVTVSQTNTGSAIATSSCGYDAIAKNNQVNFNVVGVQADVKVEKFHIL